MDMSWAVLAGLCLSVIQSVQKLSAKSPLVAVPADAMNLALCPHHLAMLEHCHFFQSSI